MISAKNDTAGAGVGNHPTLAYMQGIEEALAALETDAHRGLTEEEASARLARYGHNALPAGKRVAAWRRFLAQFRDPLVILLLVAAAISVAVWALERDTPLPYEATAILAVVLLNATMGFMQESRAATAVEALKSMSAPHATVVRDGRRRRVPASDLVPGDLIVIQEGDAIPADARVVAATALQTSESALTGESVPVGKDNGPLPGEVPLGDRQNMVFSGTAATHGHGRAVVTATGIETEIGRVAGLLNETADEPTPLQRELGFTGRLLGLLVSVLAIVMTAAIVVVQDVRGGQALFEVLVVGVALAVAAVPEGLPAVVTTALSIGVQRMARRHAIVRRLAAVEALGSATVIASDKTGTLTKNEMTVRVVVTASGRVVFDGAGYAPVGEVKRQGGGAIDGPLKAEIERALAVAERANNAVVEQRQGRWTVHGDPTEGALLVAVRKAGLSSDSLGSRLPRVAEVPFSSARKLMSTVHRVTGIGTGTVVLTKGAPEVLLPRCTYEFVGGGRRPLTPARRAEILETNEALAAEGMRTLGLAGRLLAADTLLEAPAALDERVERDLVFAGLVGMIDPPRTEAGAAVARARRAGVRPLMITGDHPRTAMAIAREVGIATDGGFVTGPEVERLAATDAVSDVSVYARVNPEHKLRIVDALRRAGAVVAMTGDGVNDAPALKKADIGVAMGISGTDVAKEAADIVLADDNFATIVAAVEEGRAIFANIRKFLRYLFSSNIAEVMTMFFGVLFGTRIGLDGGSGSLVLPLQATQILWINLVTDGAPALALGIEPPDGDVMARPPRAAGERVITPGMWRAIVLAGAVMAAGTLYVLDASLPGGLVAGSGTLAHAQTMAFTTLMLFQMFNVLNARSDERSAFVRPFTNAWLWVALAGSVVLQILVVYVPLLQRAFGSVALTGQDWAFCAGVASSVLWLREASKLLKRRSAAS